MLKIFAFKKKLHIYFKIGKFRKDFIFAKLRIWEVSWKQNPREMAKSLCRLLI